MEKLGRRNHNVIITHLDDILQMGYFIIGIVGVQTKGTYNKDTYNNLSLLADNCMIAAIAYLPRLARDEVSVGYSTYLDRELEAAISFYSR